MIKITEYFSERTNYYLRNFNWTSLSFLEEVASESGFEPVLELNSKFVKSFNENRLKLVVGHF